MQEQEDEYRAFSLRKLRLTGPLLPTSLNAQNTGLSVNRE